MYLDNKFSRIRQGELQAGDRLFVERFQGCIYVKSKVSKKVQINVIGGLWKDLTVKIFSRKTKGRKKHWKL